MPLVFKESGTSISVGSRRYPEMAEICLDDSTFEACFRFFGLRLRTLTNIVVEDINSIHRIRDPHGFIVLQVKTKNNGPDIRFETKAPLKWEAAFRKLGIPVLGDNNVLASNELAAVGWGLWKAAMLVLAAIIGLVTFIAIVATLRHKLP